jgi:hypothetical protein
MLISIDGSMTYESGKAYKANTTVSYNGSLYTATVDIEDTDTDTPDAAPDKWSMTINAPSSDTSGDISALAARVTALEDTVSGKLVQIGLGHTENYTPAASETWAEKIGKLRTQMQSILEGIEDDERIRITEIILGSTPVQCNTLSHLLSNGGSVYGDFSGIESNTSGYTVIRTVKVAMADTDNMYVLTEINNSTSVLSVDDRTSISNTTSIGFRYEIYKLIS